MVVAVAGQVPVDLYDRETLVVRPRDLATKWANPTRELARLARSGLVRRAGHGYWLVPPADRVTDKSWRPDLEALALAVAVADYGPDRVALMGVSAARHHGAIPRAVATAVVAVPNQRPVLRTPYGPVAFSERDTDRLDVEPARTTLTTGMATTVEQTLLDLADRPELGGVATAEVAQALAALAVRADWEHVLSLARAQRLHAAYIRAGHLATPLLPRRPPSWPSRRAVPGLGLTADIPAGGDDAAP
jgi:predicted transcriptional regulator of viral defense system